MFKWIEVTWLKIGHQDSSASNGHQGDMTYRSIMQASYTSNGFSAQKASNTISMG